MKFGEWQPIETAPKDGTALILFEDGPPESRVMLTGFYDPRFFGTKEGWRTDVGQSCGPDYWMPFPEPPPLPPQGNGVMQEFAKRGDDRGDYWAIQLTEDNAGEVCRLSGAVTGPGYLEIYTVEGMLKAQLDDWVVLNAKGDFYPVKPAVFEATYEKAPEPPPHEHQTSSWVAVPGRMTQHCACGAVRRSRDNYIDFGPWGPVKEGVSQFQAREVEADRIHAAGVRRVATCQPPEGQLFQPGARVKIADELPFCMKHFPSGREATVLYTYAHAYGGDADSQYMLDVDGVGQHGWYDENQLKLVWPKE